MNIFRLTADLSHLFAILILLYKIWKTRSCAGISLRSQVLFALVFTCRYLDLFTHFVSIYNTVMKVVFIVALYATVYLISIKFKATYNRIEDNFRVELLIFPCIILAIFINASFTLFEVLWTFSIYLEAVAILPQLFLLQRRGKAETITAHYLFALGIYRGIYIVNWCYRHYTENFYDPIVMVSGIVQTILYGDFFYLYITRVIKKNRKMELPI